MILLKDLVSKLPTLYSSHTLCRKMPQRDKCSSKNENNTIFNFCLTIRPIVIS